MKKRKNTPNNNNTPQPLSASLTKAERASFTEHHGNVVAFAENRVAAMNSLNVIRRDKLYREDYGTWENYCDAIRSITRQYGLRLAKAGKIRAELEPIVSKLGLPLPDNENQLNELGKIKDPQQRGEILKKASQAAEERGETLSARLIREIRENGDAPAGETKKPVPEVPVRRCALINRKEVESTCAEYFDFLSPDGELKSEIEPLVLRLTARLDRTPAIQTREQMMSVLEGIANIVMAIAYCVEHPEDRLPPRDGSDSSNQIDPNLN